MNHVRRLYALRRPIGSLLAVLLVWEAATRLDLVPRFLLPMPSEIALGMFQDAAMFFYHAAYTLQATVGGFVLAVVLGVGLAMLIVQSRFAEETVYPLLVSLNSVPKVAIAPLFIVWMGTGMEPKIAIAAMIAIFAIVIDAVHGMRSVDPEMIDLGRSVRGSQTKILWRIRLPHALPSIFAGMKVGISLALIGAIVGEFVASRRGLGYLIMVAQGQFDLVRMFGAIIFLSLIGLALFYIVVFAERIFVPWQVARRANTAGH